MKFGRAITKNRVLILIVSLVLVVVSLIGMVNTRVNYDMLTYLPKDMDTVIGQDVLLDEFGKGGFCFIVTEGIPMQDEKQMCEKLEEIDHVESVLSYASLADERIPSEIIPEKIYKEFRTDDSGLVAVFFDTSTSADETLEALAEIRQVAGKQCFVSGLTAMASDLRDLCEQEEPIYVLIAVVLATVAMLIFLDGWLVPFIFLASIGMMILLNLGTNYFFGEISYITKALSAVLQLAVTMDYSIFLFDRYDEEKERFEERFRVSLLNSYGMTETVSGVTCAPLTGEKRWPSVGRAAPSYCIKIVDESGQELAPGQVGEICVHGVPGRSLVLGYYKDEEATARLLDPDGWLHSGDRGYLDEDGWLYFIGRSSDMIKRSGENVSSLEVECVLTSHSDIADAAVIGVPDPIRDQAVKAFVQLRPGSVLTKDEITEYCTPRLAKFKRPTIIEFVDDFPRTATGKIKKSHLR